jgi:16S rRNA (adenine1518-N6/adenine1519-N6)-dimethyltransferase
VTLSARPPWSQIERRLQASGFEPTKLRGQNFLVDEGDVRAIATGAGPRPGEPVLEVGVGLGFLTRHLVALGARVIGVEIDVRLIQLARELFPELEGAVRFVACDALAGKHALAEPLLEALPTAGDWMVCANLPYNIASPLLALLSDCPHPPRAMTVLVQSEVAERLAAQPGDDAWGGLGARLRASYRARLLRRVPAAHFRPRPRVESAVVRLEAHSDGLRPEERLGPLFGRLLAALFSQRRKTVKHPLAGFLVGRVPPGGERQMALELLLASGIDPDLRVEVLPVEQLVSLVRRLANLEAADPG